MFIPRTLAETEAGPGRGALVRGALVAGIIALGLFLVLSANITVGQEDLQVGDVAERNLVAPRTTTFVSDSQTELAQNEAAEAVGSVYERLKPDVDNQEDQLRAYDVVARRVTRILEERDEAGTPHEEVVQQLADDVPEIAAAQRTLVAEMAPTQWEQVAAAGRTALEGALEDPVQEDDLAATRTEVRSAVTSDLQPEQRELAGDLAAAHVMANLVISPELTAQAKQEARDAVEPEQVTVRVDEAIVRANEVITTEDLEKLQALGLTATQLQATTIAGNALVAMVVAVLLVAFLMRFQPEIWYRNRSLLLFLLALAVSVIAIRVAADRTLWAYAVPTAATVLLIGILLGSTAGAAMAITLAIFAGVVNNSALEVAVYVVAGGMVCLFTVERAERLNIFVRTGVALALTNIAVVIAFSLLGQRDGAAMVQLSAMGVVNAGLSVILAVGSFAVLGNVFGIMTVFQLLELANPSNRLLRRLLLETPGTYHHSVMVGNLAERAAETIGADPLLARVAAYYHDIGKMKNPLAFIENQAGAHNIHDDLSAETSARIIAGHIRDGIDLAYEHRLPVQVIGFIPQHHGTSVMSYFYGKALSEVSGREELAPKDAFRYPGPKPQSREAAILMLADGVEASVRSLDDKDEASIRHMVDQIVDARVEDGQLEDAELTLKNITQIKDAFVQQLLGMYHSRIKYPDNVVRIQQRREQDAGTPS